MRSFILICILLCNTVYADEINLRLVSAVSEDNNSLIQFPPGGIGTNQGYNGKMVQLVYDWEPHRNFYLEGAVGYRSPNDIFEYASMAGEVSPGFRVNWGPLVLKLSEGISYMPENQYNPATGDGYQKVDFVTHVTIGLKDPNTGIGVYFDRSHYSNGYATQNPALNYTGFMLGFPIGRVK